MQIAGVLSHAGDGADRQQRPEPADGQGQRAEHAQLRAIVALVAIEGVTDKTAETGPPANRPTCPCN
jgi:hypothetical protein